LVFPACHLDLGAVTPGPRGFPSPVASGTFRYLLQPSCPSHLLRRHLPVCAVLPGWSSRPVLPKLDRTFFPALPDCLSWGCPKIALPPYMFRESSPSLPAPERTCCLRPGTARYPTPSALVVPPDFDGLLLTEPRRSIAPCIQPWGSSRFLPRLPSVTLQLPMVLAAIPDSPFTPSRAFPSYTAALRHRSRCLLAVILVPSPFQSLTEVNHLPASSP